MKDILCTLQKKGIKFNELLSELPQSLDSSEQILDDATTLLDQIQIDFSHLKMRTKDDQLNSVLEAGALGAVDPDTLELQ